MPLPMLFGARDGGRCDSRREGPRGPGGRRRRGGHHGQGWDLGPLRASLVRHKGAALWATKPRCGRGQITHARLVGRRGCSHRTPRFQRRHGRARLPTHRARRYRRLRVAGRTDIPRQGPRAGRGACALAFLGKRGFVRLRGSGGWGGWGCRLLLPRPTRFVWTDVGTGRKARRRRGALVHDFGG